MSTEQNIIEDALRYYDYNNIKYSKILKKIKKITLNTNTGIFTFIDVDKNVVCNTHIEFLSFFIVKEKIFKWAWSMIGFNKTQIATAKNLLLYGINLSNNENHKNILINSQLKLSNKIQEDIICALAAYLSKKPMIVKMIIDFTDENNVVAKIIDDFDTTTNYYYAIITDYQKFM